jgi:hypothetical protein
VDADAGGALKGVDLARTIQRVHPHCSPLIVTPGVSAEIAKWLYLSGGLTWSVVSSRTLSRISEFEAAVHSTLRGLPWMQPELKRMVEGYARRMRAGDGSHEDAPEWKGKTQKVGVGPDPALMRANGSPRPVAIAVTDISQLPAQPAA